MLDAIVVGLGVMGSAALHRMALAGLRVHGLERFATEHPFGSSGGGATRVTRKAYFEDARYVPLLERSWTLVREMEAATQTSLLVRTGGLYFGPAGAPGVLASYETARAHGLVHEWLDASAIRKRFPMFAPGDDDAGVYEPDAGVLIVQPFLRAQLELAFAAGARATTNAIVDRVELGESGVRVWAGGERWDAERLVLARGPWTATPIEGVSPLPIPLRIERQVQFWLAPIEPALFEPDRMPVFLRFGDAYAFYGLPHVARDGVKVCQHHGGIVTEVDTLDRTPHAADEAPVRAFVERYLPRAAGRTLQAEVCTYTNTPDEHFVIGTHPSHPRVLVMAGFSGHGFKLAPAMGELIAEMATRGTTTLDASLFDPRRFGGQAR